MVSERPFLMDFMFICQHDLSRGSDCNKMR